MDVKKISDSGDITEDDSIDFTPAPTDEYTQGREDAVKELVDSGLLVEQDPNQVMAEGSVFKLYFEPGKTLSDEQIATLLGAIVAQKVSGPSTPLPMTPTNIIIQN